MRFDTPVLLYGAGREARSTRAFLQKQYPDVSVFVTADSGAAEIENTVFISPDDVPTAIANQQFGTIVKSPGVSLYKPVFDIARNVGIPITSNLNIWAAHFAKGRKIIAITGTKGKSTTATLLHLMLTHSGIDAGLGGNVGVPPLDLADRFKTVILELSSYQTADIDFAPDLAGITNLSPEHTDWHGSVERYYADKLNLIHRPGNFAIALGTGLPNRPEIDAAIHHDTGRIMPLKPLHYDAVTAAVHKSRLKGAHNLDNAVLAARLALAADATLDGVLAGIAAFAPLPHRLEEHQIGKMLVINDSISTTPEATKAALNAYQGKKIALIAGGHERKQNYDSLAAELGKSGVKLLICLPVTGSRLADAARRANPDVKVIMSETLDAAMQSADAHRTLFDTLILSPGAPSYNQFKNFEERGNAFVSGANRLFGEQL